MTAKAINQSFGEEESVSLQDFTFPQALPPRSRQHAQLRRSACPPAPMPTPRPPFLVTTEAPCRNAHRHRVTAPERGAEAFLSLKDQFLHAPLGVQKNAHLGALWSINSMPSTLCIISVTTATL